MTSDIRQQEKIWRGKGRVLFFSINQSMQSGSTMLSLSSNTMFSQTVKTLYPGAMIGTIGEAYFRTTKEMGCPRGVVS